MTQGVEWNLSPAAIEQESFRRIDAELPAHRFEAREWRVVRRMIHTTANFAIADAVCFAADPITAGLAAMREGVPIYSDSKMIRSGLSLAKLRSMNAAYGPERLICRIDDPAVAEEARRRGQTRALVALEQSRAEVDGGIVLIGNAPLALAGLARLIMEGQARPRLVIAMPVGFVNVLESKAMIQATHAPRIVLTGRLGGSTLAVAALHGILESANG